MIFNALWLNMWKVKINSHARREGTNASYFIKAQNWFKDKTAYKSYYAGKHTICWTFGSSWALWEIHHGWLILLQFLLL